MVELLQQIEGTPSTYPATPGGLSTEAGELDTDALWQRLEAWVSHRWSERSIVWVASGPGCFEPPLSPATIATVEIWRNGAWEEDATVPASPLGGYVLAGHGPYRFTGTVGDDEAEVPAAVEEAFRRLAEYSVAREFDAVAAGASSFAAMAGAVNINFRRDAAYMAKALENSGAADLLRSWRRVTR